LFLAYFRLKIAILIFWFSCWRFIMNVTPTNSEENLVLNSVRLVNSFNERKVKWFQIAYSRNYYVNDKYLTFFSKKALFLVFFQKGSLNVKIGPTFWFPLTLSGLVVFACNAAHQSWRHDGDHQSKWKI